MAILIEHEVKPMPTEKEESHITEAFGVRTTTEDSCGSPPTSRACVRAHAREGAALFGRYGFNALASELPCGGFFLVRHHASDKTFTARQESKVAVAALKEQRRVTREVISTCTCTYIYAHATA